LFDNWLSPFGADIIGYFKISSFILQLLPHVAVVTLHAFGSGLTGLTAEKHLGQPHALLVHPVDGLFHGGKLAVVAHFEPEQAIFGQRDALVQARNIPSQHAVIVKGGV
jgi:hypothetical protein